MDSNTLSDLDKKDKLLYFLRQPTSLILVGFLYIISTINIGFNPYDSGIIITGGMRLLNGELPYKDFFTMYAPGQFYLNAFIQTISSEVLFLRFVLSFFQLGILILVYKITDKLFQGKYLVFTILLASLWLGAFDMWNRGIIVALFFNLYLVYNLINKNNNYFSNAFIISIIAFFRHDVGGLSLIIYIIYLGLFEFKVKSLKENIKIIFNTFLGFIPIILFSIYLLYNVDFNTIYEQLITFPKEVFPKYRSLPFPNPFSEGNIIKIAKNFLLSYTFYLPFLTILLLLINYIKERNLDSNLIIYSLFILPMLNQLMVRSELEHALPSAIMCIPIIFYLIHNLINYKKILIIVFLLFMPNMLAYKVKKLKSVYPSFEVSKIEKLNNILLIEDYHTCLINTINYINFNTELEDKIFVGLINNDNVFVNEASLYYLSERLPATKYHELHPGITTDKKGQMEIINSIESNRVNLIILFDNPDVREENESNNLKELNLLDDYFKSNFYLVKKYNYINIFERN